MICASVVRSPCPCGEAPIRTVTNPDGSIASCTVSHPGVISIPRAAKAGDPYPVRSQKVDSPMPRNRPSARAAACRRRNSGTSAAASARSIVSR